MRELEVVALGAADGLVGPRPVPADEAAEGVKHAAAHAECLNCGAALHGRYCAVCGQADDDHHRSIFHLLWEAVEGLTHLDGRLAKTLPPLLFNPGKLARDHFEGRRQRHVPPFRLFLITLLLFMVSLEAVMHGGRHGPDRAFAPVMKDGVLTTRDEKGRTTRIVIPTAADLARWSSGKVSDAQIERELAAKGEAARAAAAAPPAAAGDDDDKDAPAKPPAPHVSVGPIDPAKAPVSVSFDTAGASGKSKHWGEGWLREKIGKAQENPEYYKAIVFEWAHRLAILLLPIFAVQLLALYCYKRQFYVYDHLVVSMQFLSFVFLVSAVAWIIPDPVRVWAITVASLWVPVNLFMLLRGAYGSGWFGAALKTLFLWCSTVSVFGVMLVGLMALGLQQL